MDSILAGRPSVDTYSRVSYRAAVVDRVSSYWVPDHINGQTPGRYGTRSTPRRHVCCDRPTRRWKTGLATLLPFNRVVRGLKRL